MLFLNRVRMCFMRIFQADQVEPHESERAGRFVRQAKTECGVKAQLILWCHHGWKMEHFNSVHGCLIVFKVY